MGWATRGHSQAVPVPAAPRRDPCSQPEALPSRRRSLDISVPQSRWPPRSAWSGDVELRDAARLAITVAGHRDRGMSRKEVPEMSLPRCRVVCLLTAIVHQHGKHGQREAAELSAIPAVSRLSRDPTAPNISNKGHNCQRWRSENMVVVHCDPRPAALEAPLALRRGRTEQAPLPRVRIAELKALGAAERSFGGALERVAEKARSPPVSGARRTLSPIARSDWTKIGCVLMTSLASHHIFIFILAWMFWRGTRESKQVELHSKQK